jgi:16S rRNA (cytidine1402-2'-O)-methyltransferase
MEDSLADLLDILGDRQIAVAGELTKLYEEVFRGAISDARDHFQDHPARGEYTLVVAGQSKEDKVWQEEDLRQALKAPPYSQMPPSQAARELAERSGWPRRKVYNLLTKTDE